MADLAMSWKLVKGIRQGCPLSPCLRLGYAILAFHYIIRCVFHQGTKIMPLQ